MKNKNNATESPLSALDQSDSSEDIRQRRVKRITDIALISMVASGIFSGVAVAKGYVDLRNRTDNHRGDFASVATGHNPLPPEDFMIRSPGSMSETSAGPLIETQIDLLAECNEPARASEIDAIEEKRGIIADAKTPQEVATRLGLELPALDTVEQTKEQMKRATSLEEAEQILKSFVESEFGIYFDAELSYDDHLEAVQRDYSEIITELSYLPKNSFQEAEVQNLLIGDAWKANNGDPAGGFFQDSTDTIMLHEPSKIMFRGSDVVYHELIGHAIHSVVCRWNMDTDPSFTGLNAPGREYDPNKVMISIGQSDFPDEFVSNYAETAVTEDFAETARILMKDFDVVALSPKSIVDEKKLLAVVRLERFFPGMGVYIDNLGRLVDPWGSLRKDATG